MIDLIGKTLCNNSEVRKITCTNVASARKEGFTRHCRDAILAKSHNPRIPTKKKNRVRYAVFAFLVEVRGFEPRSTRPSSALSTRLVGD